MRLGLNCDSFSPSGYAKYWGKSSYQKMQAFGYSAVDFSVLGNTNTKIYRADEETRKSILLRERMLAEEAGLTIHQAHAPWLSLSRALSPEESSELLEKIKIAIQSCHVLGCRFLVVHPFMPNGWSDRGTSIASDTFHKNVTYLRSLAAFAEDYDVTLCLENMPCVDFSISTPEEILAILQEANRENIQMCFDTGHGTAFSQRLTVGREIRKCGNRIMALHVHDNYGSADQHNFPGMGMTDWKDVMAALQEIRFEGVFSLELNFPDQFSEPIFDSSCRLAAAMALEIVNELLP